MKYFFGTNLKLTILALVRENTTPAQRASRFKQLFKQLAVNKLLAASHRHLVARIYKNGWAMGPSILFLNWLADLPTTQVGAVPRYAVLRWALGEARRPPLPLSSGFPSPCFLVLTMS